MGSNGVDVREGLYLEDHVPVWGSSAFVGRAEDWEAATMEATPRCVFFTLKLSFN